MTILTTAAFLLGALRVRMQLGTASVPMLYNLSRQLRKAGVTIRELSASMGVTLVRIREVGAMERVPFLVALDFQEAIERVARSRTGRM